MTLGEWWKSLIFEDMELVVNLCKPTESPQGNEVQQKMEVGTVSFRIHGKDDDKTR